MHIHRHGIDTGRNVFKINALLFKHLKNLTAESNLAVHHGYLDIAGTESLLARNTGDHISALTSGAFHYKRSLVLRTVGIPDIDGNAFLLYREDSVFVEHGGSHIGKLAELSVCDRLDHSRIIHDPGICHKESGDVRPVLIEICMNSFGNQRSGNIRTASGEGLHHTVLHSSVESRDHCALAFCETFHQKDVCIIRVKDPVYIKPDHRSGVDKLES